MYFLAEMSGIEDQKPTLKQLYWLLHKNSHVWRTIGTVLKFRRSELQNIEAKFRPAGALSANSNRCLIELLDRWIQRNEGCTWPTIAEALGGLGDKYLKERILHFGSEINRIEKAGHDNYCKSLPLLDEYCHADSELGKRLFQTDKLARTSAREYGEELFQCLKEERTHWYEMGLLMGLDKEKLHDIEIGTFNSEVA